MSVESRELTLWLCEFASCTDRNCNFYVSPATILSNVHYFPSWVWKLANVASKVPFASSIKLATFSCGYCQGLSRICIHLRQEKRKKKRQRKVGAIFSPDSTDHRGFAFRASAAEDKRGKRERWNRPEEWNESPEKWAMPRTSALYCDQILCNLVFVLPEKWRLLA